MFSQRASFSLIFQVNKRGIWKITVVNCFKTVQCDKCKMWVPNICSFTTESQYESVQNTNCTWICPLFDFFNFSDSFFTDQSNLENQNMFDPLAEDGGTRTPPTLIGITNLSAD